MSHTGANPNPGLMIAVSFNSTSFSHCLIIVRK